MLLRYTIDPSHNEILYETRHDEVPRAGDWVRYGGISYAVSYVIWHEDGDKSPYVLIRLKGGE